MENTNQKTLMQKIGKGLIIYLVIIAVGVLVLIYFSKNNDSDDFSFSDDQQEENITKRSKNDKVSKTASNILIPESAPTLGKADAPITIVEFSDFQCPFCKASFPVIRKVLDKYPNDVKLVYRHFPLKSIHPLAEELAHASMCAHDQDKFWPMHDRLFQNQDTINKNNINDQARSIGLNMSDFVECQNSGKWDDYIEQDFADVISLGASGTPAWTVNGQLLQGQFSFELWQQIIESMLQ